MDIVFSLIMFLVCILMCLASGSEKAVLSMFGWCSPVRLVLSMAYGRFPLASLWNLAFSASFAHSFRNLLLTGDVTTNSRGACAVEGFFFGVVLCGSVVGPRMMHSRFRREIRAKMLSFETPAMSELLRLV